MTTSPETTGGYVLALAHIQEQILSGALQVGDRLPGERELAAQLGISRGAVREAIRGMQAYGVLESQPGPGRGTRVIAMQSKALGRLFSLHLATASQSQADLTETRIALERATASLAASASTPEDHDRLERIIDAMDATHELEPYNDLDTDFHQCIAQISGNPLLRDLTVAIREALRRPILQASLGVDRWADVRTMLCGQHRAIYDAIRSGDVAHASKLVEAHIRSAADALF